MGAAEQVPVIREGLLSAMSTLRRRGVRVVGAGLEGAPLGEVSMTGPFALVLGGEAKGLTQTVCRQCEELVHIPMAGPMDSLNVSVSTGILLYEKVRQDRKE